MKDLEIDELDSIPAMRERGELTKERAAMKILEIVYTNPGRFNMLDMEEDERSDFLTEMLPKFHGILERYDKSMGPLGAYIYYSIPGMRLSWEKKRLEAEIGKKGAAASVKRIYEDSMAKKTLAVAESKRGAALPHKESCGRPLIFKKIINKKRGLLESRALYYRKRSALILALKSAWYIDDESIEKLSGCFGCSNERFAEDFEKIKNSLLGKNEKRANMTERRDRAWYFVCKYRERLAFLDPSSAAWAAAKKKLDYQLASWKNKTNLLQSRRMKVTPRNKDLAKMLSIPTYRVSAYLKYARRMAESGETLLPAAGDESFDEN